MSRGPLTGYDKRIWLLLSWSRVGGSGACVRLFRKVGAHGLCSRSQESYFTMGLGHRSLTPVARPE